MSILLVRFLMNPILGFQTFLLIWLGCSGAASLASFLITGSHKVVVKHSNIRSLGRVATASVLKLVMMIPVLYLIHIESRYSLRLLGVVDFLMTVTALVVSRVLIVVIADDMNRDTGRDVKRLRVMIYGASDKNVSLVTRFEDSPNYMVMGFLSIDGIDGEVLQSKRVYKFTTPEDIRRLHTELGIEGVLLHKSVQDNNLPQWVFDAFIENGIHILTVPAVSEIDYGGHAQHAIKAFSKKDDFIPDGMSSTERIFKRMCDCFIAAILLIIFSPLFLVCWIAVKIEDGGPAIFKQERLGRFGRTFYIYKFRSMKLDAEQMGPALYSGEEDKRLTKVGRFIRAHHLDELPQLWNVFIGDMSFVGYRPERQFYIDQIVEKDPRYFYLYQIRPGVTSYATLRNGYTDTIEKMLRRLELDLYYLRNRSMWFDIKILLQTFLSIVFGKKF
ncbi:MAG: exopolysaccharide biosynthesis polyprenyl glycosylphosphotransferase [Bacteroidales bacterium]|nr:exopolysaccharide biosynthesis polyprenyl glycosylphosphotransferase [Bacteroidales bacterium]